MNEKEICVYIARCGDGSLYTGWTNDIKKRMKAHNAGTGSKYTASRRPVELVYCEHVSRQAAQKREYEIKQLKRAQKLELIKNCKVSEECFMGTIPTLEQAEKLLKQYNKEEFHLRHAKIVSGVMRYFAKEHDPENEEFWAVVGLLHDLDFEQYPDEHCFKTSEIMRDLGYDEKLIHAVASHGYNCTDIDAEPKHYMEKVLYATDELTGLIGAATLMRPSRSVVDIEVKSVMKKFKTPAFAAGCSREVIMRGAEMLDTTLEDLIGNTILAMRSLIGTMEI